MSEPNIPPWLWIAGGILLIATLTTGRIMTANWMNSLNARKWAPALAAAENLFGIPAGLLSRIAYQESHFRQDVIDGTQASSAGALGLMQLMPQDFDTVQRPIPFTDTDTQDQIYEAANLLAHLYTLYNNWTYAVAAYNAGQGTLNKVLAGTRALPAQTARYIQQLNQDLPDIVNPTLSA